MPSYQLFTAFWTVARFKALFVRLLAWILPHRQQGTTPTVLQLQDAAIQTLTMPEPAPQCLTQQVLEIVLQHDHSTTNQQTMCTLLQVSKAWVAELLRAATGQIEASIRIEHVDQLSKVASLAPWLRRHGTCVRSLRIPCCLGSTSGVSELNSRFDLRKLQLKAVSHLVAALTGGVLDHTTASLAPWSSLRTLDISLPVDGSLLAVLPTSLTHMSITTTASSTDYAALRRLQNLQYLALVSEDDSSKVPQSCLKELSSLMWLTSLHISNPDNNIDRRQVPLQLQTLSVAVREWDARQPGAGMRNAIQVGHISGLTRLMLFGDGVLSESQPPASLLDLRLILSQQTRGDTNWALLGVSGLTTLTNIVLYHMTGACHMLGLLAPLKQLQKVSISWDGEHRDLAVVASALRDVPGALFARNSSPTWISLHDAERLMQQLGALTRLQQMSMSVPRVHGAVDAAAADSNALCKHLSALTNLQVLHLKADRPFVKHDVQHMTALRSLTSLRLSPTSPNADYLSLPLPFLR